MTLLLDTHVVIWWFENSTQLSNATRDAISEPDNQVLVSTARVWEIAIKRSLKKSNSPDDFERVVPQSGFEWLSITARHASAVEKLPFIHRDPFDRLLVAQALVEDATIITRDSNIRRYAVSTLPA